MTETTTTKLLTAPEVARQLSMSVRWVHAVASVGDLRSVQFGKARRFLAEDVQRYIEQHRTGGGREAA